MAANINRVLTVEQMGDWFMLRSNGDVVATVLLHPNWQVRTANANQAAERVFVLRQRPDVEIVQEVIRRPHQLMPIPGVFDRSGDRIGNAGPAPYPNHVQPQDFKRN